MDGFEFWVRYLLFAELTILISGAFVFLAALDVITDRLAFARWEIPVAVRVFAASASLLPLWLILSFRAIPWQIRFQETVGGLDLEGSLSILASVTGFVCLFFSMIQLRRASGPGTKVSKIGSKVLLIVYALNFVGLLSGYIKPD